jgi:hypothetical protein
VLNILFGNTLFQVCQNDALAIIFIASVFLHRPDTQMRMIITWEFHGAAAGQVNTLVKKSMNT